MHVQASSSVSDEVRNLQHKLSETGETAIKQSERLRKVREEKRTLDLENTELKIRLNKAEVSIYNFACSVFFYLYY